MRRTSGDHGLTVTDYAPFGVIGAITPVTHCLPTLAGNAVSMVSSGNTVVFNPHPSGPDRRRRLSAIQPGNLRGDRTREPPHHRRPTHARHGRPIFDHPLRLLVVTGGPASPGGPGEQEAGDCRRSG